MVRVPEAGFHAVEWSPFEVSVDEDDVSSGRCVCINQVVGAVVNSPPIPQAALDLGEGSVVWVGVGAKGGVGDQLS